MSAHEQARSENNTKSEVVVAWEDNLLVNFRPLVGDAVNLGGGLEAFFQPIPAVIFLMTAVIAILTGRQGDYLSNLSQGSLIGSLAPAIVGILILFRGEAEFGLLVSVTGLTYGLLAYVCIYIATYPADYRPHNSATRKFGIR